MLVNTSSLVSEGLRCGGQTGVWRGMLGSGGGELDLLLSGTLCGTLWRHIETTSITQTTTKAQHNVACFQWTLNTLSQNDNIKISMNVSRNQKGYMQE